MAKQKQTGVDAAKSTSDRTETEAAAAAQAESQPSSSTAGQNADGSTQPAAPTAPEPGPTNPEPPKTAEQILAAPSESIPDQSPDAPQPTPSGKAANTGPRVDTSKAAEAEHPDVAKEERVRRVAADTRDVESQPASANFPRREGQHSTADFEPTLAGTVPETRAVTDPDRQTDAALDAAAEAEKNAEPGEDPRTGKKRDEPDANDRERARLEAGVVLTNEQLRERAMREGV